MSDATLGRYRLDAILGRGSMGEVFRAHDPDLERTVAIKTIRLDSPEVGDDIDEFIARFQNEARLAGRLSHPNIVTVYDYGEEKGLYYLVMEFVEGQTLKKLLAGGPLPAGESAAIVQQACDGLGAAHDAGVVHRDIKPGNLMLDGSTGLVKVMDFGIARLDVGDMTQAGQVIGTPRYMSPEQIAGKPLDARSDLFSMGAVYYEALTRRQLFDGSNMAAITHQIVNEDPAQLAGIEEEFGEGTGWVLRRALAREPEKRFQKALEFRDAIETHCLGAGDTAPVEVTPPPAVTPVEVTPPVAQEVVTDEPASQPEPVHAPEPVAAAAAEPAAEPVGVAVGVEDLPARPGQDDPVFSAPRRARGPGKGAMLSVFVMLMIAGASAVAWFQFGGKRFLEGPPPEAAAGAAEDQALAAAADSAGDQAQVQVEEPAPDPEPRPPPPVRLAFTVEPAEATITVDDSLTASPDSGVVLAVGTHRVQAEAAGYLPLDTMVELTSDISLALALKRAPPTTGTVDVQASLPGQVLVDGRTRGAAPVRGLRLRPGTYTVRFVPEGADGLAEERAVTVRAGDASRVSFDITDALISVGVRDPRWASVYAGEVKLGDTPLIEHRLSARVYTVRVVREGYVTQERLVRLTPGEHFQWVDLVLEAEEGQ
jgi:serine/threonine-protein kinase